MNDRTRLPAARTCNASAKPDDICVSDGGRVSTCAGLREGGDWADRIRRSTERERVEGFDKVARAPTTTNLFPYDCFSSVLLTSSHLRPIVGPLRRPSTGPSDNAPTWEGRVSMYRRPCLGLVAALFLTVFAHSVFAQGTSAA